MKELSPLEYWDVVRCMMLTNKEAKKKYLEKELERMSGKNKPF